MMFLFELLELELSIFSSQLKIKSMIDDNYQINFDWSKDFWFRKKGTQGMKTECQRGGISYRSSFLRKKPKAKNWQHLIPQDAALGIDISARGPPMMSRFMATSSKRWKKE